MPTYKIWINIKKVKSYNPGFYERFGKKIRLWFLFYIKVLWIHFENDNVRSLKLRVYKIKNKNMWNAC